MKKQVLGPQASFVIPAYNGAAYIAETLDSCVRQTLDNIEIIVVNDKSTDATEEIVNYFRSIDKRIKLINHTENKGRSIARNTGMAQARADILIMFDADDIALPNKADDVVKFMRKNKEIDVVYTKFQVTNELGQIIGYCDAEPFDYDRLIKSKMTYIGHSTMAFRKRVFETVQYTDGDYSRHAIDDWKFQVDAYNAGFKFAPIRKFTTQYRVIPKLRDEKKILELKESVLAVPA